MMRVAIGVYAAAAVLLACSAAPTEERAEVEPAPSHGPSGFVKIQTRDRAITLFTTDHGVRRVSVRDEHGALLLDRVDIQQLPALDARSYDVVRSSVAGGGSRGNVPSDLRGDVLGL